MDHFTSGKPLFLETAEGEAAASAAGGGDSCRVLPGDSEDVAMIKELLDSRIRPTIMEDGGDIDYVGFDAASGVLRVRLRGSCVGCSSSSATLKRGVESMMRHYVPAVREVVQEAEGEDAISMQALQELEQRLAADKGAKKGDDQQ
jgi:Fe-S cluster biogenesis protein NfuA